jgi:hypothetical protein
MGRPASVSFHARAIEVLEAEPPSAELAPAYAYQAGADVPVSTIAKSPEDERTADA